MFLLRLAWASCAERAMALRMLPYRHPSTTITNTIANTTPHPTPISNGVELYVDSTNEDVGVQ